MNAVITSKTNPRSAVVNEWKPSTSPFLFSRIIRDPGVLWMLIVAVTIPCYDAYFIPNVANQAYRDHSCYLAKME